MPESAHVDVVLAVDREGLWGRRAVPRDLDLFSGRHTVEHVTRHLCRGHPHHRRSVSGEIRPSALAPTQHLGEGALGEDAEERVAGEPDPGPQLQALP